MQTSADKQRLLARYGQTPVCARAVVAKCAAGLVILLGVLLFGLYVQAGSSSTVAVAARTGHERGSAAAAHDRPPPQDAADLSAARLDACIGRSYSVAPGRHVPISELIADAHLRCQML